MLMLRVPGALIQAKHLSMVQEICERWGNGTFHMGTRQNMDIPGIKYEYIDEVNKFIKKLYRRSRRGDVRRGYGSGRLRLSYHRRP